jgi:hypothetical protein
MPDGYAFGLDVGDPGEFLVLSLTGFALMRNRRVTLARDWSGIVITRHD